MKRNREENDDEESVSLKKCSKSSLKAILYDNAIIKKYHSRYKLHLAALMSAVTAHKWDDAFRLLPCLIIGRGGNISQEFLWQMADVITRNATGIPDSFRKSLRQDVCFLGVQPFTVTFDTLSQDMETAKEDDIDEILKVFEEQQGNPIHSNSKDYYSHMTALIEGYKGAILYCRWKNVLLNGKSNALRSETSVDHCFDEDKEEARSLAVKAHSALKRALFCLSEPAEWILGLYLELESKLHGAEAALTVLKEYVENNPQHLPAQVLSYKFLKQFLPESHIAQMSALKEISKLCPQAPLVLDYVDKLFAEATMEKAGMIQTMDVDNGVHRTPFFHLMRDKRHCEGQHGNCSLKSDAYVETLWRCVNLLTNLVEYQEWRWNLEVWKRLEEILLKFYSSWLRCWKCSYCRSSRKLLEQVSKRISPLWKVYIWQPAKVPLYKELLRICHQTVAAHVFCYDWGYIMKVMSYLQNIGYTVLHSKLKDALFPSSPYLKKYLLYFDKKSGFRLSSKKKQKRITVWKTEMLQLLEQEKLLFDLTFDEESMVTSTQMKKGDRKSCLHLDKGMEGSPVVPSESTHKSSKRKNRHYLSNSGKKLKTTSAKHYNELFVISEDEGCSEILSEVPEKHRAINDLSTDDYITADQASGEKCSVTNILVQEGEKISAIDTMNKKEVVVSRKRKEEICKENENISDKLILSPTQSELSVPESDTLNSNKKENYLHGGTSSGYKGGSSEEYSATSPLTIDGSKSIYFQHTAVPKPLSQNSEMKSNKEIFVEETQTQTCLNSFNETDAKIKIVLESQSQGDLSQSALNGSKVVDLINCKNSQYESSKEIDKELENESRLDLIDAKVNTEGKGEFPVTSQEIEFSLPFSLTQSQQDPMCYSQNGQELVLSQQFQYSKDLEHFCSLGKSLPSSKREIGNEVELDTCHEPQSQTSGIKFVEQAGQSPDFASHGNGVEFSDTDTDKFATPNCAVRSIIQSSCLDTPQEVCGDSSDDEPFVGPSQELIENTSLEFQKKTKSGRIIKKISDDSRVANSYSGSDPTLSLPSPLNEGKDILEITPLDFKRCTAEERNEPLPQVNVKVLPLEKTCSDDIKVYVNKKSVGKVGSNEKQTKSGKDSNKSCDSVDSKDSDTNTESDVENTHSKLDKTLDKGNTITNESGINKYPFKAISSETNGKHQKTQKKESCISHILEDKIDSVTKGSLITGIEKENSTPTTKNKRVLTSQIGHDDGVASYDQSRKSYKRKQNNEIMEVKGSHRNEQKIDLKCSKKAVATKGKYWKDHLCDLPFPDIKQGNDTFIQKENGEIHLKKQNEKESHGVSTQNVYAVVSEFKATGGKISLAKTKKMKTFQDFEEQVHTCKKHLELTGENEKSRHLNNSKEHGSKKSKKKKEKINEPIVMNSNNTCRDKFSEEASLKMRKYHKLYNPDNNELL